jgi:hypothetical protein
MGAPMGNKNAAGGHTMRLNKRQKKQVKKFKSSWKKEENKRAKKMRDFYK